MNKGWLQDSLLIESNCSHLGAMAWCWKTKHMIKGHAQSAEKPQLSKICQEEESLEWICFLAPHNKLTTKGLPRSWIRNQSFPPPPSPPVPQSSPLHLPISCPSGYSYVHGEQVSHSSITNIPILCIFKKNYEYLPPEPWSLASFDYFQMTFWGN